MTFFYNFVILPWISFILHLMYCSIQIFSCLGLHLRTRASVLRKQYYIFTIIFRHGLHIYASMRKNSIFVSWQMMVSSLWKMYFSKPYNWNVWSLDSWREYQRRKLCCSNYIILSNKIMICPWNIAQPYWNMTTTSYIHSCAKLINNDICAFDL